MRQALLLLMFARCGRDAMGAVEHLKNLSCLGLRPESAMVAVTPLLHETIRHGETTPLLHETIRHGETRIVLLKPEATMGRSYSEHPGVGRLYREHWRPLCSPWVPSFRAVGIGWTLHRQG